MIVTLTDLINLKFKMYYIIIKCLRNFRPKQKNRRQAMERWPMASIPILTASNAGSTSMWFNTKNIIFVNSTVIFYRTKKQDGDSQNRFLSFAAFVACAVQPKCCGLCWSVTSFFNRAVSWSWIAKVGGNEKWIRHTCVLKSG